MPSQQQHLAERFPVSEASWGGRVFGCVPEKKMKEPEKEDQAEKPEESSVKEELEKGEFAPETQIQGDPGKREQQANGELEKGEFVPEMGHRGELEMGEFVPDEWERLEEDKLEHESGRARRSELERGELLPEKGRKGERENSQEDYYRRKAGSSRKESEQRNCDKGEFVRDKRQKGDRRRTPDDYYRRKEGGSRIDSEQRKRPSLKCEGGNNDVRSDSGSHKHEISNGKYHGKDHSAGSSQKKHGIESENSTRRHHGEFSGSSAPKSRRVSEENASRSGHQDKLYSSSTVSSRSSSTNRYSSSRRHESPLPSRAHDRHAQKPVSSVQSRHDRAHSHNHRNRSPVHPDRSPCDQQERTPSCLERSPHDRGRHRDYRDRTPSCRDRSPHDRVRHREHRDRTPSNSDRSPQNGGQAQEGTRKGGSSEKHHGRREEKPRRREPDGKDSAKHSLLRESSSSIRPDKVAEGKPDKEKTSQKNVADSKELPPPPPVSPPPLPPPLPPPPPPPANGFLEDHLSMEEDMDICDTPPHAALMTEQNLGKWYYLDDFGLERGPSKLADLKRLVEEGVLPSDHLIKHFDSDRWVTVENATSPLVSVSLTSIVSDAVTQMVSPPEASGNMSIDAADVTQEKSALTVQPEIHHTNDWDHPEPVEDLQIDQRVEALLDGHDIIPGRELETIGGNIFFLLLLAI